MIMNRQEVVKALGMCYTTIYNLEKSGKFPKRKQLAAGRVGWSRAEVQAWVDGLPTAEDVQADAPKEAQGAVRVDPLLEAFERDKAKGFLVDPLADPLADIDLRHLN